WQLSLPPGLASPGPAGAAWHHWCEPGLLAHLARKEATMDDRNSNSSTTMGIGIAIGAAIGAIMGVATGNIAIYLPIGIALGIALSFAMGQRSCGGRLPRCLDCH